MLHRSRTPPAFAAPKTHVLSPLSSMALGGACLFMLGAVPASGMALVSPKAVVKPVVPSQAKPEKQAEATPPTAHDLATLAAAREANRIAAEGLAGQLETNRSQMTLGRWALGLSVVTGLAAVAAAIFAWGAWRANKRSAEVAEKMLVGYERPFLLVEVVQSGIEIEGGSVTFGTTQYRFRNLGRVPALITRRDFMLGVGTEMPAPLDPQKEDGTAVVHGVAVPPGGETAAIEVGSAEPLFSAFRQIRRGYTRKGVGAPKVYFHGFVEYRDLGGRGWITGFCFVHSDNADGFQPLSLAVRGGPDPYNYDRPLG